MLRGRNQNALFLQAGGVTNAGHVATNGFNLKAIQVGAAEDNAGSGGGREDPEGNIGTAMQPYAFALHWSPNCLFKWQVIPSKQITPFAPSSYVVFLQHIVALLTIVAKAELLLLYRIDLGLGRIKKRVRGMHVVGDIQDDLL